jgi:hypothetical protein
MNRLSRLLFVALLMSACGGPQVTIPEPKVGEGLSARKVHCVAKRHRREIRECYEERLAQVPDVAGEIMIRFYVKKDGTVNMFLVWDRNLDDVELDECIANAVDKWTFPEPEGGRVLVDLTVILAPEPSD